MTASVGAWDRWYSLNRGRPTPYGDTVTYQMGGDWLAPCALVEDWGCGAGWFRQFVTGSYLGVDGSHTPFADVIADLTTYRSTAPGVFVRHVLEHNYSWRQILTNAADTATDRLVIVLFTPLVDATHEIAFAEDPGVPDIAFAIDDITGPLVDAGFRCHVDTFTTDTQYEVETIVRCTR